MNRIIWNAVVKIAKEQLDTDISGWSMRSKWQFIKDNHETYKHFFGEMYEMEGLSSSYSLPVKNYCPDCELNKLKIQRFRDNRPNKYDNTITITLRQDWGMGDVWHLHDVEFGTYDNTKQQSKEEEM